jgi:hypothetical protein
MQLKPHTVKVFDQMPIHEQLASRADVDGIGSRTGRCQSEKERCNDWVFHGSHLLEHAAGVPSEELRPSSGGVGLLGLGFGPLDCAARSKSVSSRRDKSSPAAEAQQFK